MIHRVFAPGCALMIYKPELAEKVHLMLNENIGKIDKLMLCCQHDPKFTAKTEVINICPGCDKRFENDYPNTSTVSLWEILAERDFFNFPDYQGKRMSIIDACPTRNKEKVQNAIRTILNKMNIALVEPKNTKAKSTCCGDSFYGEIPTEKVKEQMVKRTSEMPCDDVVVYCVSCIKSVYNGGKTPHYLIDLLFAKETVPKTFDPDEWHKELKDYIEKH
jgi:Fe-S oxidoreductase